VTRRIRSFFACLPIIALLLPLSIGARPTLGDRQSVDRTPDRLGETFGLDRPPAGLGARANPQVDVLIELWDVPVLIAWSTARRTHSPAVATLAAQAQARTIDAAQQLLLPRIAQANGQVLYRLRRTLNGIAAHLPVERIPELRRLPIVKAIRPLIPKSVDNASSVSLIGAPWLWDGSLAARGEGIKIGIIDTGIDYLHTDFGGSGRAADYARNTTTVITDNVGFPNAKVAGGYDFAGDHYDAAHFSTFTPNPDPDPMDCAGHGTHVAGTAAGYGVNADGTTYAGPWNATSVPTNTMRVGPGVAPTAALYALRVFGCSGTTSLVSQALEWATDPNGDFDFSDHLDVVNLSLGTDFGGPAQDPDIDAANSAALANVIVVASAGNAGDTFYTTGAPATADWAISVASSFDSTAITGAFRVNAPAMIAGLNAAAEAQFGPDLSKTGPLTGTLRYPAGGGQNNGCAVFNTSNAAMLKGKIALIDRGICSFKTKLRNAQDAGAVGALIVNNVVGYPPLMGDDPAITATIRIPAMITTQVAGATIKAHLNDLGGVGVTLTAAYRDRLKNVDPSMVDMISSFSARGPRRGDSALKPDVTAPGDTIFSAGYATGSRGTSASGTSAAAPHVAGAIALLRELHPGWSVEELKALLMNTAGVETRTGGQTGAPFSPSRQGAGRVTLVAAAAASVIAYNADNPGQVSISFGAPQVVGATTLVKNIRVVNKGGSTATYAISVTNVVTSSGVTISALAPSVTIPAYGSATFAVRMTADATQLDRTLDPATASAQNSAPRQFLNEHSGFITLAGPDTLHVPFYAAPHPASDMRAADGLDIGLNTSSAALTLRGADLNTPAYRSRAWALELQEHNPDASYTTGLQNAGDLKYIGVGSDIATGKLTSNTMIYFGIATYGAWSTPDLRDARFEIFIDTNNDGASDFMVVNWNQSQASGAIDPSDVFVAAVIDQRRGVVVATHTINTLSATTETALFNSSVTVLPVAAGDLRLTAGKSRFTYYVLAFQREAPGDIDGSLEHSFDPAAPAISLSGVPLVNDLNGASVQVRINRGSWLRDRAQGLLLLHLLNTVPYQAEVVPMDVAFRRIFFPVVDH
jgi:subtilisin family serine protease